MVTRTVSFPLKRTLPHLFVVCLTTLSADDRRLVNNELEVLWREAELAQAQVHLDDEYRSILNYRFF